MKREFEIYAAAGVPHPCCVPGRKRAAQLEESRALSAERARASDGSVAEMVKLDGGVFLMGTHSDEAFPQDGEGPVRQVRVDEFYIDRFAVTNEQFAEFVKASGY